MIVYLDTNIVISTEEGVVPVVNSPRVGVCGYTGE